MNEPGVITAGKGYSWIREVIDYPAVTWVLHYILLNLSGAYHLTAKPDGQKHIIKVSEDDTRSWVAGLYDWTAFVINRKGEKKVVDTGVIKILGA